MICANFRVPKWILCIAVLYVSNWLVTPIFMGEVALEVLMRPRISKPYLPDRWKQNSSFGRERYSMTSYLIEHDLLIGLKLDNIIELMGEPNARFERIRGRKKDIVLVYSVAEQEELPARCWIFWPHMIGSGNFEEWTLEIELPSEVELSRKARFGVG